MPRFSYTAIGSSQKTEKGVISAESAFAARKMLRSKGLHPTEVTQITAETAGRSFHSVFGNKKKTVAAFTKELATMLRAGIKLTDALSVLIQQIPDPQLKNAITDVRDRVVTGESFAEALSEYEAYFDLIYVSMMRVGEVTGTLEDSLTTMSNMLEKQRQLEEKMTTAMMYPAILLTLCVVVVLIIMIFFLPLITNELVKVGQTLPLTTRALMKISDLLTSAWAFVILGVLFGLSWLYKRAVRTERGAALRDRFLLALPGFGPLIKQRIVSRFASTLATLLSSGMSMAESLRVVAQVTGNAVMAEAVRQARERILSGSDIATPLRDSGVISPSIAHMITVGEKSGELEQMLRMISQNLEAESDVVIERLSKFVEPIIILFMAGLIGLIAYATMVPIIKFSVTQF
ncbi:MAG TPA: type II secretion system F family protein [Anaerohalosphaeraceae bacterium]|nr:type II secretion system F family protein [Anaerohalosphaeraceae bacterium]HPP56072.1 type II secretion system F family protein [Anaerohalosphaeraceae bacterium]